MREGRLSQRMHATKTKAIIWLSIVWILVRIYPAIMGWSTIGTEVWQAHKLLEYGVQRLHGGAVRQDVWTGTIAHPEHYLYTHHPYPIIWFCAVVIRFFGIPGVAVAMFLLKYLALVLCFQVLDAHFSRPAAFWASVLYALAPVAIVLDGNANSVGVASAFWPIAVALIVFRFQRRQPATLGDLLLAGAIMFVAGQTSWFALSMAPVLAAINARVTSLRLASLHQMLANPVSLALLLGGVLALLVFLGQVAYYEVDFASLRHYVVVKAGATHPTLPRLRLLELIPVRVLTFTGITLAFASFLGVIYLVREPKLRGELAVGAGSYFVTFMAMVLVLPGFFYTENHIYTFLAFPGAVLAALIFEQLGARLRSLILLSSLLGVAVALMYASVPIISSMSKFMGGVFAARTKSTDFIFTNLRPVSYPYKASDVTSGAATGIAADRLIFFGVSEPAQLSLAGDLADDSTRFQYWRFRSLPIGSDLEAELRSHGELLQTLPLTFPAQADTLADKLRSFYWYSVMKKSKRAEPSAATASDLIDIYEVHPRLQQRAPQS